MVSRQIGHLLSNFAQFKHEAICPHSMKAQLASASRQILQASAGEAAGSDEATFDEIERFEDSNIEQFDEKLSFETNSYLKNPDDLCHCSWNSIPCLMSTVVDSLEDIDIS